MYLKGPRILNIPLLIHKKITFLTPFLHICIIRLHVLVILSLIKVTNPKNSREKEQIELFRRVFFGVVFKLGIFCGNPFLNINWLTHAITQYHYRRKKCISLLWSSSCSLLPKDCSAVALSHCKIGPKIRRLWTLFLR